MYEKIVTSIGKNAFAKCPNLNIYYYGNNKDVIVNLDIFATLHTEKNIKVVLNGSEISFDQHPIIENGRTLVPLRAIFEALGAKVSWNDASKTVTSLKESTTVELTIDSNEMKVNGSLTGAIRT